MRRLMEASRFVVVIAVVGVMVAGLATFGAASAKSVVFVGHVIGGDWKTDALVLESLKVVDTFLLAVVQLIVAVGLYELFIGELRVPEWLRVDSLEGMKKSIIDVLVVFVAVKGIERLLDKGDPIDILTYVGAVCLLVLVLTAFRIAKSSSSS